MSLKWYTLNYVQRDEINTTSERGQPFLPEHPHPGKASPSRILGIDPDQPLSRGEYALFRRAMTEGLGIPRKVHEAKGQANNPT